MHNIPFWKIILSWIYPFNIERFYTKKNNTLEVNLQYGQLVVDTKKANYSFGNLHYVFQQVLSSLDFTLEKKYNVLILGFGAGSISEILFNRLNNYKIVGIEYDPVIIQIAKKYFPHVLKNTKIEIVDAELFIQKNKDLYDLILIDLFVDTNVPNKFQTKEFLQNVYNSINSNGIVLMNSMNEPTELFENWKIVFNDFTFEAIQENKVLVYRSFY